MPKLQLALRVARCIAVAFAKAGSAMALGPHLGTLAANGLVEAVPAVAKELWASLRKPKEQGGLTPAELRTAVAELAAADADDAAALAAAAVAAESIPAEQREAVLTYLREVPAAVRRSMRRPEDPSGRTVPAYQSLDKAEDLAALLPARLPRLREGHEVHGLVLRRLLGSGGYGEVWEASPAGVPGAESVAIKFCTDERARRQLLDHEAKVVAQVMSVGRHPGIVRLLRKHLADELPSLEYEFVAGGDLQAYLTERWASGKVRFVAQPTKRPRLTPFAPSARSPSHHTPRSLRATPPPQSSVARTGTSPPHPPPAHIDSNEKLARAPSARASTSAGARTVLIDRCTAERTGSPSRAPTNRSPVHRSAARSRQTGSTRQSARR